MNSPCRGARGGRRAHAEECICIRMRAGSLRARTSPRGRLGSPLRIHIMALAAEARLEPSPGTLGARGNAGPRCTRTAARGESAQLRGVCGIARGCAASLRLLHTSPGESAEGCWYAAPFCVVRMLRRRQGARARRYCDGELGHLSCRLQRSSGCSRLR